ncbi:hypothetical protein RIR_jg32380.t1 [Rhizophagus irregularis DAOM 181602=DAOM 197198]|nr:hypothetical protein RIR_jg32380.t1 [Rhizophagus irregularis DAOM 181602=DAOM 197198]
MPSSLYLWYTERSLDPTTCALKYAGYRTAVSEIHERIEQCSKASTSQETSASKFTLYRSQLLRLNRKKNTKFKNESMLMTKERTQAL